MNLIEFIRLIRAHFLLLFTVPILMAGLTYWLVKDGDREYTTTSMIYTGLSTGVNIENMGESRRDQFVVNNSFENIINTIKSKETMREVGFRVLARVLLLKEADGDNINPKNFEKLKEWITPELRKQLVVPGNEEATFQRLTQAYKLGKPKEIQTLFNEDKTPFSLKVLSEIKAVRKGSSDMIELSYTLNDKGLCEQTLIRFLAVFMYKYKNLKVSETGNVVEFFENQLNAAKNDLQRVESTMKNFREQGQILNYYEQSKALAGKKEDITDEQSRLVGEMEAAENALKKLEEKLSFHREAFFQNKDLLDNQEAVAQLRATQPLGTQTTENPSYKKLMEEELKLKAGIENLYQRTHSTEGLELKPVLESWLENMILLEKNKSKSTVLAARMREIRSDYARFAPIGSDLSRLEREIGVYERAYIQILQDLNQAILKKQSIELSSKLNIVDQPVTVIQPSKKVVLVILSGIVGFVLVLALLIVMEVSDRTIKTSERAEVMTSLSVIGTFPVFTRQSLSETLLMHTLVGQMLAKLKVRINPVSTPILLLVSTQPQEGKTLWGERIQSYLAFAGAKVVFIRPEDSRLPKEPNTYLYPADMLISEVKNLSELANRTIDLAEYDYCLLELPALLSGNVPAALLRQAQVALLTVTANRSWKKADKKAIQMLHDLKMPVELLVNGVQNSSLENLLAEKEIDDLPWKRRLKRIFRLEFSRKEWQSNTKNNQI